MGTQVILNPIGSGGDVFPFIALGQELQRRKHHVAIMTNPIFKTNVGQAGLEFIDLGTESELRSVGRNQDIHDHRAAWKLALRWGAVGTMRQAVSYMRERRKRCPTLLVSSPLSFGARIAAATFEIPLATIVLSPYLLRSVYQSPLIKPMWLSSAFPKFVKSLQFQIADRFFIDPVIKQDVNDLQRELGLPTTKRFLHRWCFSNDICIGAFSAPFAPPQPDWPDNLQLTGNFVWEPPIEKENRNRLFAFLDANPDPVIVTVGSAGAESENFYQIWIDACNKLNHPVVILEQNAKVIPNNLAETILHLEFYPMKDLLNHASAIVHSGGIGTSLRSLQTGVPQIIIPRVNDQYDNARRIESLGAGTSIATAKLSVENAYSELQHVSKDPVFDRAEQSAIFESRQTSVLQACDLIETLFDENR